MRRVIALLCLLLGCSKPGPQLTLCLDVPEADRAPILAAVRQWGRTPVETPDCEVTVFPGICPGDPTAMGCEGPMLSGGKAILINHGDVQCVAYHELGHVFGVPEKKLPTCTTYEVQQ